MKSFLHRVVMFAGLVVLLLAAPHVAHAQSPILTFEDTQKLFETSNTAFEAEQWEKSLEGFERIARSGHGSPAVWGNAGAAAWRSGDTGKAVLYYRRALRADPGYDRALSSLKVIAPAASAEAPSFLSSVIEGLFTRTTPLFWVIVLDVFLLVASWNIWRAMRTDNADQRAHFLALIGYSAVAVALCGSIAYGDFQWRAGGNEAVVLKNGTSGRSAPAESSQEILVLPAGTTITLTEEPNRGFVRFRLPDGSAGYVSAAAVEKI